MSAGDRGKWSEGKVRDQLDLLGQSAGFAGFRLPDAHAGSFQPTWSDFLAVCRGVPWFIEVKEIAHEFRLPSGKFSSDKRARMKLMVAAGARTLVLVCFTKLKEGLSSRQHTTAPIWRECPVEWFDAQAHLPSWDMRELPLVSLPEVMKLKFGTA